MTQRTKKKTPDAFSPASLGYAPVSPLPAEEITSVLKTPKQIEADVLERREALTRQQWAQFQEEEYKKTGKAWDFSWDELHTQSFQEGNYRIFAQVSSPRDLTKSMWEKFQAHARWRKRYIEAHRKRWQSLAPAEQDFEYSAGLIPSRAGGGFLSKTSQEALREKAPRAYQVIRKVDSFFDVMEDHALHSLTFGARSSFDPIYGQYKTAQNPVAAATGTVMGELASFAVTSYILQGLKLPASLAKLAKGSSKAAKLFRSTGYLHAKARQIVRVPKALRALASPVFKQGLVEGAVMAQTTALARGIKGAATTLVQKYKWEDSLSHPDYKKYVKNLPPAYQAFLQDYAMGWGISFINAPATWGARMIGDALWATGEQSYAIATGQQAGWNTTEFLKSWIIGYGIGEMQGFFSSSAVAKMMQKHPRFSHLAQETYRYFDRKNSKVPRYEQNAIAYKIYQRDAHQQKPMTRTQIARMMHAEWQMADSPEVSIARLHLDGATFRYIDRRTVATEAAHRDHRVLYETYDEMLNLKRKGIDFNRFRELGIRNMTEEQVLDFFRQQGLFKETKAVQEKKVLPPRYTELPPPTSFETWTKKVGQLYQKNLGHPYQRLIMAKEDYLTRAKKADQEALVKTHVPEINRRIFSKVKDLLLKDLFSARRERYYKKAQAIVGRYRKGFHEEIADNAIDKVADRLMSMSAEDFKPRNIPLNEKTLTRIEADIAQAKTPEKLARTATGRLLQEYLDTEINTAASKASDEFRHVKGPGDISFYDPGPSFNEDPDAHYSIAEYELGQGALRAQQARAQKADAAPHWQEAIAAVTGQIPASAEMFARASSFSPHRENTVILDVLQRRGTYNQHIGAVAFELKHRNRWEWKDIARHLNELGLNRRNGKDWTPTPLRKVEGDLRRAVLRNFQTREIPKTVRKKVEYTPEEIQQLHRYARTRSEDVNPLTGIKQDLFGNPHVDMLLEQHGGYVFNAEVDYRTILDRYGKATADKYLEAMADIFETHVSDINANFNRAKTDQHVYLKNPTQADSTRFVLLQTGMTNQQFREVTSYLQRIMTRPYSDSEVTDSYIAVALRESDKRIQVLHNFQNTTVTQVQSTVEVMPRSTESAGLKTLVNYFWQNLPRKEGQRMVDFFNNVYYSQESRTFIDSVRADIPLIPRTDEGWRQFFQAYPDKGDIARQKIQALPDKLEILGSGKLPEVIAKFHAQNDPRYAAMRPDERQDFLNQRQSHEKDIDPEISARAERTLDISEEGDMSQVIQGAGKVMRTVKERDASRAEAIGIQDTKKEGVRGFLSKRYRQFKEFIGSGREWGDNFFDALHMDRDGYFRQLYSKIWTWVGDRQQIAEMVVDKYLNPAFDDVFRLNIPRTDKNRFNVTFGWGFEQAKNNILNLKTGQIKIQPTELNTPYKMAGNLLPGKISLMINQPWHKINSEMLYQIENQSSDPLLWPKIFTQEFKIPAKVVCDAFQKMQRIYYAKIEAERFAHNPAAKAKAFGDRLKTNLEAVMGGVLREEMQERGWDPKKIWHYPPQDFKQKMKQLIEDTQDGVKKQRLLISWDIYFNRDPANMSYTVHMVMADKWNENNFYGELKNFIKGKTTRGARVLSPVLSEMQGRKTETMKDLHEGGYAVYLNTYENARAALTYVMQKNYNANVAVQMKKYILGKARHYYDRYIQTRGRLLQSGATNEQIMNNAKNIFKGFAEDLGGYFYVPGPEEFARIKKDIRYLKTALAREQQSKGQNQTQIAEYQTALNQLRSKQTDMNILLNIWSGRLVVDDLLTARKVQRKAQGFKPLTKEEKQWLYNAGSEFAQEIGNNVVKWAEWMPLNKKDFLKARGDVPWGENVVPDSRHNYLGHLYSTVRTESHKGKVRAPSLYGFEGLYVHKSVMQAMDQFLFRSDLIEKTSPFEAVNVVHRVYRKIGSTLKNIRHVKPLILGQNDVQQAFKAAPFWIKNVWVATKAYLNRYDKESPEALLYRRYNGIGDLFNSSVSMPSLVSTMERSYFEMMGDRNPVSRLLSSYKRALSTTEATTGVLPESIEKMFKWTGTTVKYAFKGQQELAWGIDSVLRIAVAKTMEDRYLAALNPKYRDAMGNPTAAGRDLATRKACWWTNTFMVQYARMPHRTRKALNMIFMYPTYRLGNMRADFESLRMFLRSIQGNRVLDPLLRYANLRETGQADSRYNMYDDQLREAIFEAGPFLRSLAMKYTGKALMQMIFGYGSEDIWDFLIGYRLKKLEDEDNPLDRNLKFLSMSGPVFEWDKIIKRPLAVTLRYNLAAVPAFFVSWMTNRNIITLKRVSTVNWKEKPHVWLGQKMLDALQVYFPFAGDYPRMNDPDLNLVEKIITFSGLGYFYSSKSPRTLLNQFRESIDKANTPKEREKAVRQFRRSLNILHERLFKEQYKSYADEIYPTEQRIGKD